MRALLLLLFCLTAHADEIGFMVKFVDDKGFLRVQTLGGWDPSMMAGQRVFVHPHDQVARAQAGTFRRAAGDGFDHAHRAVARAAHQTGVARRGRRPRDE